MTDSLAVWLKAARHAATLPRLLLFLSWLLLAGCQSFTTAPDGWDPEETDPAARQSHRPATSPGLFKRFKRTLTQDGSECWANWWTAPRLPPDVWSRLQRNYEFKTVKNDRVATELGWYVRNQDYLNRVSKRAERYLYHVANELEKRNLPGELALLPIVESAYNPYAYSTSRAAGLWQFIPGTAKHLGMNMNWWYDDRRDVVTATDNALNYLTFLRDHYNGDWLKALAAYNAGFGTIDRAVAKNRARGLPTDYWHLDVPDETRAYVPKMLALAQLSHNPKSYGIYWQYVPDLPYFAPVSSRSQIDIPLAADTLGISTDELYLLNPGLSRWATPPGKPFTILVPIDQANDLQEYLANSRQMRLMGSAYNRDHANPLFKEMEGKAAARQSVSSSGKSKGQRSYKVKGGDTWWSVAKKAGISSSTLQKLNGADAPEPLKIGQTLVLPGKGGSTASSSVKDTISKTSKSSKDKKKSTSKKTAKTGKGSHTVRQGDTLMSISRNYKLDVDDLATWNGLNKKKYTLKIGQKIRLQP